MPWNGDQFDYTIAYINGILEFYHELFEAAFENPGNNAAILLYDLKRALTEIKPTPKQVEALLLRIHGLREWEIGRILNISREGSHYRLLGLIKKIQKKLNKNTY